MKKSVVSAVMVLLLASFFAVGEAAGQYRPGAAINLEHVNAPEGVPPLTACQILYPQGLSFVLVGCNEGSIRASVDITRTPRIPISLVVTLEEGTALWYDAGFAATGRPDGIYRKAATAKEFNRFIRKGSIIFLQQRQAQNRR